MVNDQMTFLIAVLIGSLFQIGTSNARLQPAGLCHLLIAFYLHT